jgi:hypothetical protein
MLQFADIDSLRGGFVSLGRGGGQGEGEGGRAEEETDPMEIFSTFLCAWRSPPDISISSPEEAEAEGAGRVGAEVVVRAGGEKSS